MRILLMDFFFITILIVNQAERCAFVDANENKIHDEDERKQDAPFHRNFFKFHVHEITNDVICFHNCKRDECIKQNCFRKSGKRNAYFENGNAK